MDWTETKTNIMRDIFLLMKRNADVQDTEEYWCRLTDQVNQICTKYKGHDLAVAFCVASYLFYQEKIRSVKGSRISDRPNIAKMPEDGTGSRRPLLGDAGVSPRQA